MKKASGYIIALVLGIIPAFFVVFNSVFSDSNGSVVERLYTFLLVIVSYGILGLIFGFIGRNTSWWWGVLLVIPAILLMIFYTTHEPGTALFSFTYILVSLVTSCLASYLGARLASKRKG